MIGLQSDKITKHYLPTALWMSLQKIINSCYTKSRGRHIIHWNLLPSTMKHSTQYNETFYPVQLNNLPSSGTFYQYNETFYLNNLPSGTFCQVQWNLLPSTGTFYSNETYQVQYRDHTLNTTSNHIIDI